MEIIDKEIYHYLDNGNLNVEKAMEDYRNYIYAIIKRICINLSEEDIEEIYVEVFFVLWKNQSKLDINKPMSSYLRGVTINLIKHKWREKNNDEDILEYEEKLISNFDIETILARQEKEMIISNELGKMKSKDRDIFIAYYYQNKTINEISELYGLSNSNIKIILFRIRKKIKKILVKGGYDCNE